MLENYNVQKFEHTGELLRKAREQLCLTQEQFALTLGVKLSRLQKWESGVNEPRFTIAELRALRQRNRDIFYAITTGFLLQTPKLFESWFVLPISESAKYSQESKPQHGESFRAGKKTIR
jgi:transcriptional regulator with XRE-family HTH domain